MMADVDRISALPEEIKLFILKKYLSIADAVRTSALSRSWRHLWTLLLGFNPLHLTEETDRKRIFRSPDIIHHLISSLRGPIQFSYLIWCSRKFRSPHVQSWQSCLDLIFQKDALQMLCVHCTAPQVRIQLPYFRLLRDLNLCGIELNLPIDFCGFDHLTTLKLRYVRISQQDLQVLIDRSKKLTFVDCDLSYPPRAEIKEPLSVTFSCPLLKIMGFHFQEFVREARVVSAPCLERAYVAATIRPSSPPEVSTRVAAATLRFMEDIAQVSHLELCSGALLCLSRVDMPHTLRVHFHQLRHLRLCRQTLPIDRRMCKMFCCLLRSMPFLETLQVQIDDPRACIKRQNESDPIPANEYKKKEYGFHCLEKTLRRLAISMVELIDFNDMMWMMRFILLNAKVLGIIEITYSRDYPEVKSRILEELCEVEKASLNAQVVFVQKRFS